LIEPTSDGAVGAGRRENALLPEVGGDLLHDDPEIRERGSPVPSSNAGDALEQELRTDLGDTLQNGAPGPHGCLD
jgi:hypothetical protein